MKYFISFLFLALVAASQATSRRVDTVDIDEFEIENFINWSEIWQKINDFMKKAKDTIDAMAGDIKGIIDKIKQQIKDLIEVGSISEISDKIIKGLKEIFGQVNATILACIDKQKDNVKKIATEVHAAAKACAKDAQDKLTTLETEAKSIRDEAIALLKNTATDGAKCILKPSTASECLTAIFDNLKTQSKELWIKAQGKIYTGKKIVNDTTVCTNQLGWATADKIMAVFNEVRKCAAVY